MAERVRSWLGSLDSALGKGDVSAAVELFQEDECFWRDLVALTWNLYTAESRDEIRAMLEATVAESRPCQWEIDGEADEDAAQGMVQACIRFQTARARGRGHVRIKGNKCWTLLTAMTELKGHEEKPRQNGTQHGVVRGRKAWQEERKEVEEELGCSKQPYCVVVGGGQGGIALGARLKRLGVPTIIVEKNARPGDSWRNRYKSLSLHLPVWLDHLPYIPFPDHWPVFSPKDKIGDWLEAYTKVMELVYWTSTECKSAKFDYEKGTWEVELERVGGEKVSLFPKELVLAMGITGVPRVPSFPGAESFLGVQVHSSLHKDGKPWTGKQCVVIGSNNSAHDIAADLWEQGAAQVTMIQRSPTQVVRSKTFFSQKEQFHTDGGSTDSADLLFASVPYKLYPRLHAPLFRRIAEIDAGFYERLKKAGFLLDFGDDGDASIIVKWLQRQSGYYIDVGASELVASGELKVKSGATVKEVKERSIVLSNGSEVEADLIVYATGYGSITEWVAKLISQEVADKVGKVWGLGSNAKLDPGPWERELRNMWKPTQQRHLWFHGGGLLESRLYSLHLALQLKARMEGIPTPVFGVPVVHHAR